jgi:hypothetical protein
VARKIVEPERDEVSENFRTFHNEEHRDYVRMVKSRRLRWAGNLAGIEKTRDAYRILA